ncbi:uncharacterized protein LOC125120812 [Phacochoerus africanus]|uniref:uncharacterized protein LOC125120812 n=1 Tax=Phacochoerus africanus TaxID=41426 RepID=UPI001FD8771D|nr:uncharacterized protein LOC125120812 [Phacochoerus africanus]
MEKQLWGPLGGAGVEVEVSARAQLSKSSGAWGAETTGQGNAEERARTLFRLLRTSASLFFSGSRRSRSPLTSSYSRAAAAAPSSFPLPLLLRARRAAPHPDQSGSLLAVGEKGRQAQVSSIFPEHLKIRIGGGEHLAWQDSRSGYRFPLRRENHPSLLALFPEVEEETAQLHSEYEDQLSEMGQEKRHQRSPKKVRRRVPWWLSKLRIQRCHCCGSGHRGSGCCSDH